VIFTYLKKNQISINFYFALLIAVFLPFKFLISPLIGCWLIYNLFSFHKLNWISFFKNTIFQASILFFLAHAIAYFFSVNKKEALFSIELKLSFLILPILFFISDFDNKTKNKLLFTFVFSCLLSVFICIINSLFYFFKNNELLTYNNFCLFMHPSYFSMYLCFSVIILFLRFNYLNFFNYQKIIVGLSVFILLLGIFFAASKMGILTFLILIPVVILYILWMNKNYKLIIISVLFFTIGSLFFLLSDSIAAARLRSSFQFLSSSENNIDKSTTESNAVRVLVWQQAIQLIKEKPILGYTPGDVNDKLYASYKENELTGALENKLNAHNQFLQTSLGIGVIGLLILLSLILFPIINGIKTKNVLIIFFSFLLFLNFIVESMLQTSAGTLFFTFFIGLFNNGINSTLEKNKNTNQFQNNL
jgi:O-antigen ligase